MLCFGNKLANWNLIRNFKWKVFLYFCRLKEIKFFALKKRFLSQISIIYIEDMRICYMAFSQEIRERNSDNKKWQIIRS